MALPKIVDVEWLKGQLDLGADIRVLDVSWYSAKDAQQEYLKAHIPGAVYLDPMAGADNDEFFPRNVAGQKALEANACAAGINTDTSVVLYDAVGQAGFFIGARAWWTLNYYGHTKVAVLNGGLQAWQKAGFPVSTEVPKYPPGNFKAIPNEKMKRTFEEMQRQTKSPLFQVVDSRGSDIYGNGHFPNAVNVALGTKLINSETGLLRTDDELKQAYKDANIDLSKPVVSMCNSGMSSCSVALTAMHLGATDVSIYLGGMTEWGKKSSDQVEKS